MGCDDDASHEQYTSGRQPVDNRYTVPLMTSPPSTKTMRVSHETHTQIMALAEKIDGTVDDAIGHLLGQSTVRVPVSDVQRGRWESAAERAGVSIEHFVSMRVEAAVQYNGDPGGLQQIYEHVAGIARALQLYPRVPPESIGPRRP